MMTGNLVFESEQSNKTARYRELLPQLGALIHGELDETACLANAAAALSECFHFFWVGFYRVHQEQLVLGPFQGPVACTRIQKGKGVCGTAWDKNQTILVPDVDEFPGHIACSSLSRSEIVIPLHNASGHVMAILDIDSIELNSFDEQDQQGLEAFCELLEKHLYTA